MIVWRVNGERTAPQKYDSSHPRRNVLDQLAELISGDDCVSVGLHDYLSVDTKI